MPWAIGLSVPDTEQNDFILNNNSHKSMGNKGVDTVTNTIVNGPYQVVELFFFQKCHSHENTFSLYKCVQNSQRKHVSIVVQGVGTKSTTIFVVDFVCIPYTITETCFHCRSCTKFIFVVVYKVHTNILNDFVEYFVHGVVIPLNIFLLKKMQWNDDSVCS